MAFTNESLINAHTVTMERVEISFSTAKGPRSAKVGVIFGLQHFAKTITEIGLAAMESLDAIVVLSYRNDRHLWTATWKARDADLIWGISRTGTVSAPVEDGNVTFVHYNSINFITRAMETVR